MCAQQGLSDPHDSYPLIIGGLVLLLPVGCGNVDIKPVEQPQGFGLPKLEVRLKPNK